MAWLILCTLREQRGGRLPSALAPVFRSRLAWTGVWTVLLIAGTVWVVQPVLFDGTKLALNKSEVAAGGGSYTLTIRNWSNCVVHIRYSIDNGDPAEFVTSLNSSGQAHFDVGDATAKGTYRLFEFRKETGTVWRKADAAITVK